MSKTYRRKGYEDTQGTSWDRRGRKTAGYYTKVDWNWWTGEHTYREPTKRELFKLFRWAHGESKHRNQRSPGRYYRECRMRENRSINKQEIVKWIKFLGEYEPLFESDPRSAWWDWM